MRPIPPELRSERLVLRRWREADDAAFCAMNADPEVRRHYPDLRTERQSVAEARAHDAQFEQDGFGLWALERPGEASFIGYAGVRRIVRDMPFEPRIETGWRLARAHWGRGYATEAARTALADFFARSDFGAVVSFTATTNLPSQRVMQRLGMTRDPSEDFEHPALPLGHPLSRHVLYRLDRAAFDAKRNAA